MVRADFPTPPPPTTTSLYSVGVAAICPVGEDESGHMTNSSLLTDTLASFPGWYEGERMYLGMRLRYQMPTCISSVANPFIAKTFTGLTLCLDPARNTASKNY